MLMTGIEYGKDEFLLQVKSVDTYGINLKNSEWNEYQIQMLGYEKIADRLAYHNRFLYQKRIGWTFIHPISV